MPAGHAKADFKLHSANLHEIGPEVQTSGPFPVTLANAVSVCQAASASCSLST